MKKFTKIIALVLAVVLTFALAACSNSGDEGKAESYVHRLFYFSYECYNSYF